MPITMTARFSIGPAPQEDGAPPARGTSREMSLICAPPRR